MRLWSIVTISIVRMYSSEDATYTMTPGSSSNFQVFSKISDMLSSGIQNFEVNLSQWEKRVVFHDDEKTVISVLDLANL